MTDLSEESVFEASRYAFAVWSCLVAIKKRVRNDSEGPKRLVCWAASGQPVCVVVGGEMVGHGLPRPWSGDDAQFRRSSCQKAPFWVRIALWTRRRREWSGPSSS